MPLCLQAIINLSTRNIAVVNGFEEVVLPGLQSELEMLRRQEQQARAQEAEAEQQVRDEQLKLDGLNDLLDRYNKALEDVGRK